MKKYRSNIAAYLHRAIFVFGLLIVAFGGFFFLTKSVETQSIFNQSEQNLQLGKLVFSQKIFTVSGAFEVVKSTNADGTGELPLTSFPPSSNQPSWSPDGTKIVYIAENPGDDIYVMNADGSSDIALTQTSSAFEQNPSWSVNGKIAYERNGQIWVMNADGTNQMQFPGITQPAPLSPVWSPDGTILAFTSSGEIWLIQENGMFERRLTMNSTVDTDPIWSPDGSRIVYSRGVTSGIGMIGILGFPETILTNGTDDRKPSWSNDGTKIAFVRRGTAVNGIYTMDVNGANQVRVIADIPTSTGTENDNPAWQSILQTPNTFSISGRITRGGASLNGVIMNLSGTTNATATTDAIGNYQFSNLQSGGNYTVSPSSSNHFFTPANRIFNNLNFNQTADFTAAEVCTTTNCAKNGKIAFVRNSDIFTINADGTNQRNITNNAARNSSPNWSPDGVKIVFSTDRDGNNEIYRLNAEDDINPTRLTTNTASDTSPYYSPDSSTIVFVSSRDGNSEIYKMNANGSNQVRLTTNTLNDFAPAFSPDGQKIIYVVSAPMSGMKLFTMNADGSNQQAVPDPNSSFAFYERPSYSPDGSKIIFTYSADVQSQPRLTWTANTDGTNRVMLPGGGGLSASYSPDGTKVVFNCCTFDNSYRLRTVNVNGTGEQSLTPNGFPPNSPDLPDWQPLPLTRRTPYDFDGDGRSDISVFRQSDRIWYLLRSNAGFSALQFGLSDDTLAPADYDGDLKTDVAVWRGSEGNFYVLNSFNNTVRVENFGLAGDVPTGGDYDGDGKADLAVYRGGANGVFYYRASMGNPNGNITALPWGITGDKPVSGDYDGDGKMDAAIFRPSNGVWYVRKSSDGQLFANAFGLANDTLVPADYDADGKTDLAVFRQGSWYIMRSLQGFTAFQYGISNDAPVPADYDGDGRADAAIFRNGVWYILKTQTGATEITSFGIGGDNPIPSAFVR